MRKTKSSRFCRALSANRAATTSISFRTLYGMFSMSMCPASICTRNRRLCQNCCLISMIMMFVMINFSLTFLRGVVISLGCRPDVSSNGSHQPLRTRVLVRQKHLNQERTRLRYSMHKWHAQSFTKQKGRPVDTAGASDAQGLRIGVDGHHEVSQERATSGRKTVAHLAKVEDIVDDPREPLARRLSRLYIVLLNRVL